MDKISAEEIAKTKDATAEELEENKRRILRYITRMHLRKDDPFWQSLPDVKLVMIDGKLDIDAVRTLYAERGIMNEKQFVQAYEALISDGDTKGMVLEPSPEGLEKFQAQEAERLRLDALFQESQEL